MDTDLPVRKPIRLKNYDYGTPGAYFITVCTREKRCTLSRIVKPSGGHVGAGVPDGPHVVLTPYGQSVEDVLFQIDRQYPHVCIDRYVIMPNHIHLLIRILERDGSSRTPTPTNATVPMLVSTMKRMTDRQWGEKLWQRSYYDHVIRNEDDWRTVAEYIDANPAKWSDDRFYIPA